MNKSYTREAPPRITTTSAAILGLLAAQAGTAYELAGRMRRNHHFIWPRAESKLYEEVKRLLALELVTATPGATGKRPRTVYRISARGRRALAGWSKQPSAEPSLSFEALVKLAYADFGSIPDARAQIASVREYAEDMISLGRELGTLYLDGEVELPARAHTNVLVWCFLGAHYSAMRDWAQMAEATVLAWDGTRASKRNSAVTRRAFKEGMKRLRSRRTRSAS
jgi:PadR family transcriptional regulator AphA